MELLVKDEQDLSSCSSAHTGLSVNCIYCVHPSSPSILLLVSVEISSGEVS